MEHPDEEVRRAVLRLTDALCAWERNTGLRSVFILREENGFAYRAVNGKPNVPSDIPDSELLKQIQ
jgi:hypothetical protein